MPESDETPSPVSEPEPRLEQSRPALAFGALLIGLGAAAGLLLLDVDAVAAAASLYELAESPSPYFQPGHALLLYVRVPLILLCAFATVLGPGLLLTLPSRGVEDLPAWLVKGFAVSVGVLAVVAPVADALGGGASTGRAWVTLLSGLTAIVAAARWLRWRRTGRATPAVVDPAGPSFLLASAIAIWLLSALLAPKFLWESFNGDGAHAYEACRNLLRAPVPFFGAEAAPMDRFPGTTSLAFAYPGSWFLRLFGEVEAAARVPVLLYLALLVGAVLSLARWGTSLLLGWGTLTCAWGWAAVYLVALGFSATYSPYSADLALPATQDTLFICCLPAFVLAALRKEWPWIIAFALLLVLGLPSGPMLIGLWLVARFVFERPRPVRQLVQLAAVVAACMAVAAQIGPLCAAMGWQSPGGEYDSSGLLRRFSLVQFTDVSRCAYVLIPAGIVPLAALPFWKRQDTVSRCLTAVGGVYFGLFYVQGGISLHHFVPAMVLPWPVALRVASRLGPRGRTRAFAASLAGLALAFLWALPPDLSPYVTTRHIGATVEDRTERYAAGDPAVLGAAHGILEFLPATYEASVPDETFGFSPTAVAFYAHRGSGRTEAPVYVLLPAEATPPVSARRTERPGRFVLYVVDEDRNAELRTLTPGTGRLAPLLSVPRGFLFPGLPLEPGKQLIRLGPLVRRMLGQGAGER